MSFDSFSAVRFFFEIQNLRKTKKSQIKHTLFYDWKQKNHIVINWIYRATRPTNFFMFLFSSTAANNQPWSTNRTPIKTENSNGNFLLEFILFHRKKNRLENLHIHKFFYFLWTSFKPMTMRLCLYSIVVWWYFSCLVLSLCYTYYILPSTNFNYYIIIFWEKNGKWKGLSWER